MAQNTLNLLLSQKCIIDYFKRKYENVCHGQLSFQNFMKFMNHINCQQDIFKLVYQNMKNILFVEHQSKLPIETIIFMNFRNTIASKAMENDIKTLANQMNDSKSIEKQVKVEKIRFKKIKHILQMFIDQSRIKSKLTNMSSIVSNNKQRFSEKTTSLSHQYEFINHSFAQKLKNIFGLQYKINDNNSYLEIDRTQLQIRFEKYYYCENHFLPKKQIMLKNNFADIRRECKKGQICYMRHMGRQWQYITPMYKGKVNQYCTDTCFVVILKDSDNESFQKNVVQNKEPTIGDIYTVRHKQYKDCSICVVEPTENGQVKCRILDNQRQTVITHSKQQLISKYVKRNISMEQVSIESKFGGGLTNLGNTCYMNSVIQIILHLRIPNLFNQEKPFGRILKDIGKKIQNHNTLMHSTDLKKFVDKQMNRFARYNQQDAHQFLIAVFQRLSEQNKSVVDEYFTGQTQRTLKCIKCNHIERIKDTTNVFSIPIQDSGLNVNVFSIPMQDSGLNVKILFIDNSKHSMIEFSISLYSTVTQWLQQFKHAAKIGLKDEFAVFRIYNGQIIEQFTYDSQKRYVNLNIDNSDSIVAYLLNKITQKTLKCTKSQIYNKSKQNNGLKNSPSIIQNTSRATLIKVLNYDQTYYEYMNYPFCFKLHLLQFIYAIRTKIQQIVGFKKDINIKVFKKNTQKCYFCQKYCLDSKCFDTNSHKVAIGKLDNLVTYVIEWKSQKDYKQNIITVKQQRKQITKQQRKQITKEQRKQITKQQMDLQKSLEKMKKNLKVQLNCEKCNHYQLDSSQTILNTPIILSFQLKRFIVRDKNIIKTHTKWNLQKNIKLCGHNYKLRGVILHLGQTCNSGHYIAVIDGIKYDDQRVSYFSFDNIDTSQIFILFYQRILC